MIKLVKYGAPWCGPCVAMGQLLEMARKEYPDLCIEEVNIDLPEYTQEATELNIRSIPTLVGFRDGVVVSRNTGMLSYPLLKEIIENLIQDGGKGTENC